MRIEYLTINAGEAQVVKWSAEFTAFPGIKVRADDIKISYKRKRDAGPFIVIQRDCSMALDTAFRTNPGDKVHLWPPHGQVHQLWHLRATREAGEVLIVSGANGLALDATATLGNDVHPVMSEVQPKSDTQRWRVSQSPDGVGVLLRPAHRPFYLSANGDAERGWEPWFEGYHGSGSQQWILALPHVISA